MGKEGLAGLLRVGQPAVVDGARPRRQHKPEEEMEWMDENSLYLCRRWFNMHPDDALPPDIERACLIGAIAGFPLTRGGRDFMHYAFRFVASRRAS